MKQLIATLFLLLGWGVFFEHNCCDVVAVKRSTQARLRFLCIEAERSRKNILRNAQRNFRNGCDVLLIVVPDLRMLKSARCLINRCFSASQRSRIALITVPQLQQTLLRLKRKLTTRQNLLSVTEVTPMGTDVTIENSTSASNTNTEV